MRIGEIVESTSTYFVAESLDLRRPPELGRLVKVHLAEDSELYAVVCYGQTGSLDPGRRAVRRGTEEVYDEQVYREHPQLKHVLRTEFTSLAVGVLDEGVVHQGLPSQPPPLHYSVHGCDAEETNRFTQDLYYFRLLLGVSVEIPADLLLAGHLKWVFRERDRDEEWLQGAAREVAHLLRQDCERLATVLSAIERGES
jgi:hypothetical protein